MDKKSKNALIRQIPDNTYTFGEIIYIINNVYSEEIITIDDFPKQLREKRDESISFESNTLLFGISYT